MAGKSGHSGALAVVAAAACLLGAALGAVTWVLLNAAFYLCDLVWNGLVWASSAPWTPSLVPRWAGLPVVVGLLVGLSMPLPGSPSALSRAKRRAAGAADPATR